MTWSASNFLKALSSINLTWSILEYVDPYIHWVINCHALGTELKSNSLKVNGTLHVWYVNIFELSTIILTMQNISVLANSKSSIYVIHNQFIWRRFSLHESSLTQTNMVKPPCPDYGQKLIQIWKQLQQQPCFTYALKKENFRR